MAMCILKSLEEIIATTSFYSFLITNIVLLILKRQLLMSKHINFSLLFSKLPIFLISTLLIKKRREEENLFDLLCAPTQQSDQ